MVMLFEDNKNMAISKMLQYVYGNNVLFSSGNKNLINIIKGITDIVYAYIDAAIDAPESLVEYYKLKVAFKGSETVKIIRIPCIEYFALLTLNYFKYLSVDEICNILYVRGKSNVYKSYSEDSFEQHCKQLLNKHISKCFHNTSSVNVSSWYLESCKCNLVRNRYHCKYDIELSLEDKIGMFILYLPVFIADKNSRGYVDRYDIRRSSFDISKYNEEYDNMLTRMLTIITSTENGGDVIND